MYYTIYQTKNLINGKIYIGKHQTKDPNDSYLGSGKHLRDAIKKYGKEKFSKEVLFIFDTEEEMNSKEKELITEEFVSRTDTYNLGIGGEGGPHFKGKRHSNSTKKKIAYASSDRIITDETRIKYKSRKHSPETIEKIRQSRLGKKHSIETKGKIAKALTGKVVPDEIRKKISETKLKNNDA